MIKTLKFLLSAIIRERILLTPRKRETTSVALMEEKPQSRVSLFSKIAILDYD
jgi:hypothetical protein